MKLEEATVVMKKFECVESLQDKGKYRAKVRLEITRTLNDDEVGDLPNCKTVRAALDMSWRAEGEGKAAKEELRTGADMPVATYTLKPSTDARGATFQAGGSKVKDGQAVASWQAEAWVDEADLPVLGRCSGKDNACRLTIAPLQQELPGTSASVADTAAKLAGTLPSGVSMTLEAGGRQVTLLAEHAPVLRAASERLRAAA